MTAKERIMMLSLLQKLEKRPNCAKALGIEAFGQGKHPTKPK